MVINNVQKLKSQEPQLYRRKFYTLNDVHELFFVTMFPPCNVSTARIDQFQNVDVPLVHQEVWPIYRVLEELSCREI